MLTNPFGGKQQNGPICLMNKQPDNIAFLSLGSNVGSCTQNLANAIIRLNTDKTSVITSSDFYISEAITPNRQPDYYNCVVKITTQLNPENLLALLKTIEIHFGRFQDGDLQPRIIDLDILLFNQITMHSEHLTIPHPRMHLRKFVLLPLIQVLGDNHLNRDYYLNALQSLSHQRCDRIETKNTIT